MTKQNPDSILEFQKSRLQIQLRVLYQKETQQKERITITIKELLKEEIIQEETKIIKKDPKLETILLDMRNPEKIEEVIDLIFREKI